MLGTGSCNVARQSSTRCCYDYRSQQHRPACTDDAANDAADGSAPYSLVTSCPGMALAMASCYDVMSECQSLAARVAADAVAMVTGTATRLKWAVIGQSSACDYDQAEKSCDTLWVMSHQAACRNCF